MLSALFLGGSRLFDFFCFPSYSLPPTNTEIRTASPSSPITTQRLGLGLRTGGLVGATAFFTSMKQPQSSRCGTIRHCHYLRPPTIARLRYLSSCLSRRLLHLLCPTMTSGRVRHMHSMPSGRVKGPLRDGEKSRSVWHFISPGHTKV